MRALAGSWHLRCLAAAALLACAREPTGLDPAFAGLAAQGRFSGAIVIRGDDGVRFARGYGLADPFTGRRFTPETPADSGSLAKPVTAAAVLMLARAGRIDLDVPVRRYLPEYPHEVATVRHLLAHSAGLPFDDSPEAIAGKDNSTLLAEIRGRSPQPTFAPGTAFAYCNLCSITLALLIERVTGRHYLDVAHDLARLPPQVTLRPQRLADWTGRAIGYRRRGGGGDLERFDSWEGEAFYGSANLSISASQLAAWGAQWWTPPLSVIRAEAATRATIGGNQSGLSWGNWYCANGGRRCHYLGHHEGFHHMLYWDADRRVSIAMLSNNALAPALQQRVQRALVAFAEGRAADGRRELAAPLTARPVSAGRYLLAGGETVTVSVSGKGVTVERGGIVYPAYPTGAATRYVPGLDVYLSGAPGGGLNWLSLYEDAVAKPIE